MFVMMAPPLAESQPDYLTLIVQDVSSRGIAGNYYESRLVEDGFEDV